jgi:Crinkler effector protein N-terminal domain
MPYTLFCIILRGTTLFPVTIDETRSVGELKEAIKKEKEPEFDAFDADALTLYRVKIDGFNKQEFIKIVQHIPQDPNAELNPISKLSQCFQDEDLAEPMIRILVQLPQGEPTYSRAKLSFSSELIDQSLWCLY